MPSAGSTFTGHKLRDISEAPGNFTGIGVALRPRFIARALVSYFLDRSEPAMAFLIALGFHTYLRTGEILKLQVQDVALTARHGVVTIKRSKTGLRFNIDEAVAINDRTLFSLLGTLSSCKSAGPP